MGKTNKTPGLGDRIKGQGLKSKKRVQGGIR